MGEIKKERKAFAAALAEKTAEELVELAAEKGIALDAGLEKEQIIQAIVDAEYPGKNKEEPSDATPDETELGTIGYRDGAEMVYVGGGRWVPVIKETVEAGKPVTVVCQKRAGKTIFATTGRPITFDADGRATVSAADGNYLGSIVIDGKPEYTAEGNG